MGFGIKTWVTAFAAAVLGTFMIFYGNLYGFKFYTGGMALKPWVMILLAATQVMIFAEYVYSGRKDSGKQLMYRFVQHGLLGFVCAYGGYIIYSKTADLRGTDFPSATSIYNVLVPACFQRYFLVTGAAAVVCVVIWLIRRAKGISAKDGDRKEAAEE